MENRTRHFIGTRTRYGVDTRTRETRLTHVERGYVDLNFFDGIQRNGCHASTSTRLIAQSKAVVEHGSVNGDVVQTAILTTEWTAIALRRQAREVIYSTSHRGERIQHLLGHSRRCPRTIRAEYIATVGRHPHLLQLSPLVQQLETYICRRA